MKFKYTFFALSIFALTFYGCNEADYGAYETWDVDQDEAITEEEFYTTYRDTDYFEAWDVDGDGIVEAAEWETGVQNYYPVYDYDAYGYYEDWDLDDDEILNEDEFMTGTYGLWDTDNDGNIEAVEYEEWYHEI